MKEEMFVGNGGLRLFMRSWQPSNKPHAVLAIVHGFKAHSGLYEWPGEELSRRGMAVYAMDLRGHGKSEGERQYVENIHDYVEDVHRFTSLLRQRHPELPIFLLGHSAGGVISCMFVLQHQADLAGFICESFAHEVPAPDFALAILKGLSHIAPNAHVLKLEDEGFSRIPAFVERMKTDPLIDKQAYPAHTVAVLVRADETLKRDFNKVTVPVFIMHGVLDRVTMPRGSQRFYDHASSPDKTLKLYDGYFHDLLNDEGKEAVLADIVEWINARAGR